jgi:hypothetical protein
VGQIRRPFRKEWSSFFALCHHFVTHHPGSRERARPSAAAVFFRLSFPKKSTRIQKDFACVVIYLINGKKLDHISPAFLQTFWQPNRVQLPGFPRLTQQKLCHFVAFIVFKKKSLAVFSQ